MHMKENTRKGRKRERERRKNNLVVLSSTDEGFSPSSDSKGDPNSEKRSSGCSSFTRVVKYCGRTPEATQRTYARTHAHTHKGNKEDTDGGQSVSALAGQNKQEEKEEEKMRKKGERRTKRRGGGRHKKGRREEKSGKMNNKAAKKTSRGTLRKKLRHKEGEEGEEKRRE